MRFLVLAFDYDGTLAKDGRVGEATIDALERARASGRKLLLVSGRELDDLRRVFDHEDLFDCIVAENGAMLYWPAKREEQILAERPDELFVAALRAANVTPLSIGRVVVATWEPNEAAVLEVIRELGLDWQITFNKGAVMVLPPGVNKGTGLTAALEALALSSHNVLAIGDAENDLAFLSACECGCAVANALPFVKERADFVSALDHGAGVVDIVNRVLDDDFADATADLDRHLLFVSTGDNATPGVSVRPYGEAVLVAGASGSGKSTVAHAFRELLQERGYQYCIIDPEGDYEGAEGVVHFGDPDHRPNDESVLQHLADPRANAVVNLLGMSLDDRPGYLAKLLARLLELRGRTGHPHWIMIDEAHHMLPVGWERAASIMPETLDSVLMVTVHPESVAPNVLAKVDLVIGVGPQAHDAIESFARGVDRAVPGPKVLGEARKAIAWRPADDDGPLLFSPRQPRGDLHRHKRKYAEGDLQDNSFYFLGPERKLNLRAQNLTIFVQMADGVDDETWLHHLRRHDYSQWFRECVKDPELADIAAKAEEAQADDVAASRDAIRSAIEDRYTASA